MPYVYRNRLQKWHDLPISGLRVSNVEVSGRGWEMLASSNACNWWVRVCRITVGDLKAKTLEHCLDHDKGVRYHILLCQMRHPLSRAHIRGVCDWGLEVGVCMGLAGV